MPLFLWGEATATAVYVRNRSASISLDNKTPYELWFGEKPSVTHLKIFGSTCYVHIPKDLRSKWEVNSIKMIFLGYNDGSKAYKVYDPVTRRCYIRRDVIFGEKSQSNDTIIIDKSPEADLEKGDETVDTNDQTK